MSIKLLGNTSRVETPFIAAQIGNFHFGVFNKEAGSGVFTGYQKYLYPNFVKSLNINKVNGAINNYTLVLQYQITAGDDPNFLEKVFSTQAKDRKMILSYGDYSSPSFLYKQEQCTITDIRSNLDFGNSSITYTISAISDAMALNAGIYNFPRRLAKPSTVIKELLYRKEYGIQEVFFGMRDTDLVTTQGLIASDDKEVWLDAKNGYTIFNYLNYLVESMSPASDISQNIIKSGKYVLTVRDDYQGIYGGPYFTVKRLSTSTQALTSLDVYEIDIGYPGVENIISFSIDDDQTYSILYNYQKDLQQSDYIYRINDNGNVEQVYSPAISNSRQFYKTTEKDKLWWTSVTQYPIKATLTLKGLLKAATLMSYVKVNVYFYGQKHLSSGLYTITRQQDSVDASGYKTVLSLSRIGGDEL